MQHWLASEARSQAQRNLCSSANVHLNWIVRGAYVPLAVTCCCCVGELYLELYLLRTSEEDQNRCMKELQSALGAEGWTNVCVWSVIGLGFGANRGERTDLIGDSSSSSANAWVNP
ncbi:hypothetical protein GQ600_2460 [Phytophthora cactorum]|nr:hypothetical protein GQ600_2460 [Phytophthora cactorum]